MFPKVRLQILLESMSSASLLTLAVQEILEIISSCFSGNDSETHIQLAIVYTPSYSGRRVVKFEMLRRSSYSCAHIYSSFSAR